MDYKRFLAWQRKAINFVTVLFVALVSFMWAATGIEQTFGMGWGWGWGWDRQMLWLAPAMVLFALLVRFCAMAVFRVVG